MRDISVDDGGHRTRLVFAFRSELRTAAERAGAAASGSPHAAARDVAPDMVQQDIMSIARIFALVDP